MCVYVCVCVYACMCVCVCERTVAVFRVDGRRVYRYCGLFWYSGVAFRGDEELGCVFSRCSSRGIWHLFRINPEYNHFPPVLHRFTRACFIPPQTGGSTVDTQIKPKYGFDLRYKLTLFNESNIK